MSPHFLGDNNALMRPSSLTMLHINIFQSLAVQVPLDGSVIFHSNTLRIHTHFQSVLSDVPGEFGGMSAEFWARYLV